MAARDRLAAMRAQQQGSAGFDSAPTQASSGYAEYELKDTGAGSDSDSMASFYSEISSLQDSLRVFGENVARIGDLHSRSLNNTDDEAARRNAAQLDELIEDTSALSTTLKRRVKALEKMSSSGRDGQIRKQQTTLVKTKFVEAIQNYQTVEQQYRAKYRQRLERQIKIVKPDASPEEIHAVVNDEKSGGQIFTQALMNSSAAQQSTSAYREAQERHEDIKRIERTLGELAQLFNDMSMVVEEQEEVIDHIEAQAAEVEKDTEVGLGYTTKAVDSARAARKKRWICLGIAVIVLIIVAIIIAVVVTRK